MSRVIAEYYTDRHPPMLRFYVFHAPHRRMHVETIRRYRNDLRMACMRANIAFPIDHPIDLEVTFINPTSPDNGNIYLALEQAMDGKTLSGPGIVTDDALISKSTIRKMFIGQRKHPIQPVNLPRFVDLPTDIMEAAMT